MMASQMFSVEWLLLILNVRKLIRRDSRVVIARCLNLNFLHALVCILMTYLRYRCAELNAYIMIAVGSYSTVVESLQ